MEESDSDPQADEVHPAASRFSPAHQCSFIVFSLLAIFSFLLGVIAFLVGLVEYRRARNSSAEFFSPQPTMVLLHWLVVVFATASFAFLSYARYRAETTYFLARALIPGLLTIFCFCYVYYLVLFLQGDEYLSTKNVASLDQFETYQKTAVSSEPFEEYSAAGERGQTRCLMSAPILLRGSSSVDASILPKLSRKLLHRVVTDVFVNWTYNSIIPLVVTQFTLKKCLPANSDLERRDWTFEQKSKFEGFLASQFVTKSGKLPWKLSRPAGILAGLIGAGILYVYRVDSVPITRMSVVKVDAVMEEMREDCSDVNWACSR